MRIDNLVIKNYLRKKRESVIIDLIIRDYNKSNFYIALVFNSRIEKFKVLYIPLDVCEYRYIKDYVCYQFINVYLAEYIIKTLKENEKLFSDEAFRNKLSKYITNYYIEMNSYVNEKHYKFVTTRHLPEEWLFLFEVVSVLFEHIPVYMNELGLEILAIFNNFKEAINYKYSVEFDLFKGDLRKLLFDTSKVREVSFLESICGKYIAIVDDSLVIVEYDPRKILNLYSLKDEDSYIYNCLVAIREERFRPFYKLMVVEDVEDFDMGIGKYYLCYGIENNKFLVIEKDQVKRIDCSLYKEGLVKVLDEADELKKELEKI